MNGQINFLSVSRTITGEANSYIKLAVEIHGTITVIHVQLQHIGRSFIVICRRVPSSSIINRPLKKNRYVIKVVIKVRIFSP